MRCEIEKRGTPNQTTGLIGVQEWEEVPGTWHRSGMVAQNIILADSTQKNKLAWPTIDSSLTKAPKRSPIH